MIREIDLAPIDERKTAKQAVLPEVAICRQTGNFGCPKNGKNRQFWPFGDLLPEHYHIKMQ